MSKRSTRIWSFLMVIILIINMLPVQVFALGTEQKAVKSTVTENLTSTETPTIIEEIVERRTEYTKEFRLSNGLQLATVYGYPVHFEENGEWKEIDNTLKASRNRSENVYMNTAGIWNVILPQNLTKNNGVRIVKDGYTLNFRMTGEMHETNEKLSSNDSGKLSTSGGTIDSADSRSIESSENAAMWIAEPAAAVTAAIEAINLQEVKSQEEHPEAVAEKLASRLSYESVYENTDIMFDLTSNKLKESIILKEYCNTLCGYSYAMNTGTMVPVLQEDGGIEFRDTEDEELVMYMPAPYLIDDSGETSYDIEVSIGGENGAYILSYLLPRQWLAEESRQWPVILDPTVLPGMAIENIHDMTIGSGGYANYSAEYLYCGYNPDNSKMAKAYIFLKHAVLPELTASDVIVDAKVRLNVTRGNYDNSKPLPAVEVHKVKGTWNVKKIRWENQPDFDPKVEDYKLVYPGTGHQYWTVTDIVRGWYETGVNTGMMFKAPTDIEAQQNLYHKFNSSDHSDYYYYTRPYMTIVYRNSNGLENYWSYTSSSAGRAGTGHVNQQTGALVWTRNDIAFDGNRMPVSISHVYNSNNNEDNLYGMGYGWKTNFHQNVHIWASPGTGVGYIVWEDGDGTKHYFPKIATGKYIDEDGLELVATNTGSGAKKYAITDKYGNCSYFDTKGRLREQTNNQKTKSSIVITYTAADSSLISTITDGAGRVYTFTYDENKLLSRISYSGTGIRELSWVTFAYDANGNLTSVTDKDGLSSTYTYTDNHLLTSGQDVDGYKLSYSYMATATNVPNRIVTVSESHNGSTGMTLGFEYARNQTKLTEMTGDSPAPNGNVQVIQFNDLGNVVSIQDSEGRAQFSQYAKDKPDEEEEEEASTRAASGTDNAKANQLKLSSKLQNTVANIWMNSSFEPTASPETESGTEPTAPSGTESSAEGSSETDGGSDINGSTAEELIWNAYGEGTTCTITNNTAYLGTHALEIVSSAAQPEAGISSAKFKVEAGATYTFSAYVKASGAPVYLAIQGGTEEYSRSEPLDVIGEWKRLEVSYTNNSGADKENVTAHLITQGNNTVHMDCVQLEKAATASRYNLVQNGDFTQGSYAWSSNEGLATAVIKAPATQLDANVYKMTGDMGNQKRISQTVKVSGKKGDTYVLAGWAKADSVPFKDDREFSLIATFQNGETKVNSVTVKFNAAVDSSIEWQYAAEPILADGTYDSILVEVAYDYNANTAYFDGIQLFKEEFGQSYTYDEDGNIISVKDVRSQTTNYEYENNDLTKEILPSGAVFEYDYDKYHNVIKATTSSGVVYEFEYDDYGNNTKVSVTSGDVALSSSATYTADGNYLLSTTDAIGNTTTYHYDLETGVLNSVEYPTDVEANPGSNYSDISGSIIEGTIIDLNNGGRKTDYTYDDMYRLATARQAIDEDTVLTAQYTYVNDLLTQIITGAPLAPTEPDETLKNEVLSDTLQPYEPPAPTEATEPVEPTEPVDPDGKSTTYTFGYGNYSLRSNIKVGDRELANYEYTPKHNLEKLTYGNGDTVNYIYDSYDRLTKQEYDDGDTVAYQYDNNGALATVTDSATGIKTTYFYDLTDRLMKYVEKAAGFSHIVGYEYDLMNNLSALIEAINGTKYVTAYSYDKDNRVTSIIGGLRGDTTDGSIAINSATVKDYTYDNFGRVSEQVTSKYNDTYVIPAPTEPPTEPTEGTTEPTEAPTEPPEDPNKTAFKTDSFEFSDPSLLPDDGKVHTTSQVSAHNIRAGESENEETHEKTFAYDKTFTYTYDANGNITKIEGGGNTITYTYDAANQLIREDNQAMGYTHTWTYDDAGNILTRSEYAYTENEPGVANRIVTYLYDDSQWGDLQTGYIVQNTTENGTVSTTFVIERDNIGNPTGIECGDNETHTYTWEHGRQLAALTQKGTNPENDITWNFTYNADGIRTRRTNGSTTYSYVYNGSSLSQMTVGENKLNFLYDATGAPMVVIYNNVVYYYVTNLQGDVIAILDSTGNAVVEYSYDAWGKLLSTTGSKATTLGQHNPLRYRGYVYDPETALYYLQSRYYDPELGRFINGDEFVATGQGLLGNNMFAYCNNNPVNLSDPNGTIPFYDSPIQKAIDDFLLWYRESDEDETDDTGKLTLNARIKRFAMITVKNLEFSAGVGLGLYGDFEVLEFGFDAGMYGNIGSIHYSGGHWCTGQELYAGCTSSLIQEYGFADYTFMQNGHEVERDAWKVFNSNQTSITVFSVSKYLIAGGSISLGFNVVSFVKDWNYVME